MRTNSFNRSLAGWTAVIWVPLALLILCESVPGQRRENPLQFPPPIRQRQQQEQQQPGAKTEKFLKIRIDDGMVTADITDSSMHSVLLDLAERTGIVFEVRAQENPPVSLHVSRIPLQQAIQRIASNYNAIFYYDDETNSSRITLVRIYPRTSALQPALVYLGTGAVTKVNNSIDTTEQALQTLSGESTVEQRETAIEFLVKSKSEAAVKALMRSMADPDVLVKVAAIEGLAELNAHAALPGILRTLKDEHPGVRQSAVEAVAVLGTNENLKDLRPLRRDGDPSVAAAAEAAIRKLSAPEKEK